LAALFGTALLLVDRALRSIVGATDRAYSAIIDNFKEA